MRRHLTSLVRRISLVDYRNCDWHHDPSAGVNWTVTAWRRVLDQRRSQTAFRCHFWKSKMLKGRKKAIKHMWFMMIQLLIRPHILRLAQRLIGGDNVCMWREKNPLMVAAELRHHGGRLLIHDGQCVSEHFYFTHTHPFTRLFLIIVTCNSQMFLHAASSS